MLGDSGQVKRDTKHPEKLKRNIKRLSKPLICLRDPYYVQPSRAVTDCRILAIAEEQLDNSTTHDDDIKACS